GISLCLDFVMNHTASSHRWAKAAQAGDPKYQDYYYCHDDRTIPDQYDAVVPEVFPATAPGNFTWNEQMHKWVLTSFYPFQWDLNYRNPNVLVSVLSSVLGLANLGVEVFRIDAVPYIWKELGTNCRNLPQVHAIVRMLRIVLECVCPAVVLKGEVVMAPKELAAYFGTPEKPECHMLYNVSIMVNLWSALASGDVRLLKDQLDKLNALPENCWFVNYLRCHDDIGWAISDEDCAAIGWNGATHRRFLSDWYSGNFPASRARGLVFQHNPATDDRRISGTAASLIGLENDEVWNDIPAAELDIRALRLAHAIIFGWGGIPVIWSGDELATPNDPHWAAEPGHADDNRWAGRPRLDADRLTRRHDRSTTEGCAFTDLVHLAEVRRGLPHLHAGTPVVVDEVHDPGVLPVRRTHELGTMLQLYNVTPDWRFHSGARLATLGLDPALDALTGQEVRPGPDGRVWLPPYAAWWLVSPEALRP
ncbi:MAG: alpha-amylase, partial [Austwickia sp.]|nr:alpha-amylase [Austwickia sp.]